jgi:hypothetical protein
MAAKKVFVNVQLTSWYKENKKYLTAKRGGRRR